MAHRFAGRLKDSRGEAPKMIIPFSVRLWLMGLAGFFLVHLVLGSAVSLLAPLLARAAGRSSAARAANLLLAARLAPAVVALVFALFVFMPVYIRFEPAAPREHVGLLFLAAAFLGAATCGSSLLRGLRVALDSSRYVRNCERAGSVARLSDGQAPVLIVDDPSPLFLVAGVFHPRLVISRRVVDVLSSEQLDVAIQHEHAHQASRDNLKRLLILLAPNSVPFVRGFRRLENEWGKLIEWAADDRAVRGDSRRSVALADALVRFTRAGTCARLNPLLIPLTTGSDDLRTRVERLLRESAPDRQPAFAGLLMMTGMLLALAILTAGFAALPAPMGTVYLVLERFHTLDVISGRF
jgi:beta-lactamase regulating signal transducer with metallopeptidase domain